MEIIPVSSMKFPYTSPTAIATSIAAMSLLLPAAAHQAATNAAAGPAPLALPVLLETRGPVSAP